MDLIFASVLMKSIGWPAFMLIILIIALKGTIEIFFTITLLRCELFPTRTLKWPRCNPVQIMCNTLSTYHMQHVCHLARRDSSAIKFDRVEITSMLALSSWLKPLTNEGGGGNWSTCRKPLMMSFRKCHILKPENSSPDRDSNPHSGIGGRLGKQTC